MQPVSKRIIKPKDCVIGIGLPLTQKGFFEDQKNLNKDFVRNCCSTWTKYNHEIVNETNRVFPVLTDWGLKIKYELVSSEIRQLFDNKLVVIIFSHWKEDCIELYDGLIKIKDLVDQIPTNWNGIIDLCICHPKALVDLIDKERPKCLTRYSNRQATPAFWINFYLLLFKILNDNNKSYLLALEETVAIFQNFKTKNKSL